VLTKEEQENFYKKLGLQIRIARKNAKYKQEILALELGLTRTSLVNIEHGNQKIPLHILLDLARILEVEMIELLPTMNSLNIFNLSKKSESSLSKEVEQKVDNLDRAMEKLKHFITITQIKKH